MGHDQKWNQDFYIPLLTTQSWMEKFGSNRLALTYVLWFVFSASQSNQIKIYIPPWNREFKNYNTSSSSGLALFDVRVTVLLNWKLKFWKILQGMIYIFESDFLSWKRKRKFENFWLGKKPPWVPYLLTEAS